VALDDFRQREEQVGGQAQEKAASVAGGRLCFFGGRAVLPRRLQLFSADPQVSPTGFYPILFHAGTATLTGWLQMPTCASFRKRVHHLRISPASIILTMVLEGRRIAAGSPAEESPNTAGRDAA